MRVTWPKKVETQGRQPGKQFWRPELDCCSRCADAWHRNETTTIIFTDNNNNHTNNHSNNQNKKTTATTTSTTTASSTTTLTSTLPWWHSVYSRKQRLSLVVVSTPALWRKNLFSKEFDPTQSQLSRPITWGYFTFVECGLPILLNNANTYTQDRPTKCDKVGAGNYPEHRGKSNGTKLVPI